jgi:hypothetical protein
MYKNLATLELKKRFVSILFRENAFKVSFAMSPLWRKDVRKKWLKLRLRVQVEFRMAG